MKRTITQLKANIDSYSELSAPLSIDPELDGGIKGDILDTLDNKARNKEIYTLASLPSSNVPTSELGIDGNYYLLIATQSLVFQKVSGSWNSIDKLNDMMFCFTGEDSVSKYYSLSNDLNDIVLIHTVSIGDPSGTSVKFVAQTLTEPQKEIARTNIDTASKTYIDNQIAALKNGGAIGASLAGSVMPWMGSQASIPNNWALINETQTWYSKIEYAQLYAALGGESNTWGLTSTTFSIPFFPAGSSIVKNGTGFASGAKGGTKEETLTIQQIPPHSFFVAANSDRGASNVLSESPNTRSLATQAMGNVVGDDNNAYVLYAAPDGQTASIGKTNTIGGGLSHNNMSPYVASMWIIKLKNTGGNLTASINANGHLILTDEDGNEIDSGAVSAYAAALIGGYSGTEQQFNSDLSKVSDTSQSVGGYSGNVYISNTDSEISGIKTLVYTPDATETVLSTPVQSSDGDKLSYSFIHQSPIGVSQIPSGLWSFSLAGYVSSAVGETFIGVIPFKYSTGGVKTYIFASIAWSKEINFLSTAYDWIPFTSLIKSAITTDPTDKIGIDIFVKTSGVSRTVYYIAGDGMGSYCNVPLQVRHNQLRALNQDLGVQHIDSAYENSEMAENDKLVVWDNANQKAVLCKNFITPKLLNKANAISLTSITTEPTTPSEGDYYYASATNLIYRYIDGAWASLGYPEAGTIYLFGGVNYLLINNKLDSIDQGASVPVNISIFKRGANGIVDPQIWSWINNVTVTSVRLMSNCIDISVTIGTTTYDHTTLVGVTIPAGTEIIINDISIAAGKNNANAIIIF